MRKLVMFLILAVFSLNLICATIDYSAINHQTLPVYTESLEDPEIRIVFEDKYGLYIMVEYQDVLYVYYLKNL